MQRRNCAMLALSIAWPTLLALQASGQATKAPPEWKPEPAVLKKLETTWILDAYTLQPPKNYTRERPKETPPGLVAVGWSGEPRKDGSKASIRAMVVQLPPSEEASTGKYTLEQLAETLLGTIKRNRSDFQEEKAETGTISGLTFLRVRWEGVETKSNRKMQGFVYVARDGLKIIQLLSQDYTPEATESLPLTEASILTFKKKKP